MKLHPGVMAITHGLVVDVNCNDMLVELIEFVPIGMQWSDPHGYIHFADVDSWAVVSMGGLFHDSRTSLTTMHTLFAPRNLRPINGGESSEESIEAMRRITSIPSEVTA